MSIVVKFKFQYLRIESVNQLFPSLQAANTCWACIHHISDQETCGGPARSRPATRTPASKLRSGLPTDRTSRCPARRWRWSSAAGPWTSGRSGSRARWVSSLCWTMSNSRRAVYPVLTFHFPLLVIDVRGHCDNRLIDVVMALKWKFSNQW